MKVALIHTVPSVMESIERLIKETFGDIELYSFLDGYIVKQITQNQGFGLEEENRLKTLLTLAEETDADLIVNTCSTLSVKTREIRDSYKKPIMVIDDQMLEVAVEMGPRITILATAKSTLAPTHTQLLKQAEKNKRNICVTSVFVEEAMDYLKNKDTVMHNKKIFEAYEKLDETDVVVLAQASMAHMKDVLSLAGKYPVLASPQLLMEQIKEWIEGE